MKGNAFGSLCFQKVSSLYKASPAARNEGGSQFSHRRKGRGSLQQILLWARTFPFFFSHEEEHFLDIDTDLKEFLMSQYFEFFGIICVLYVGVSFKHILGTRIQHLGECYPPRFLLRALTSGDGE
jgi:hypothetical protein